MSLRYSTKFGDNKTTIDWRRMVHWEWRKRRDRSEKPFNLLYGLQRSDWESFVGNSTYFIKKKTT